jgi:hypothetical protein
MESGFRFLTRNALYACEETGQSVQRVATGWAAVGSQFESQQRQDSSLHVVHIGSRTHWVPWPFPGNKGARSVKMTTQHQLMLGHVDL